MKKLILITAMLIVSTFSFSQNVLFLKSGDKMNGKLDGYKNDTIIFKFQGNKLKFKTSDILSIYFDEKLVPQEQSKTATPAETKPLEGRITGVVTFYFNKNYGDKPDVGAEVFIADSVGIPDFNFATVDSFHYGNFYRGIAAEYKQMKGSVPSDVAEQVKKWNVEDKALFDSLDRRAATNLFKIKYAKDGFKTVVDGSGNYSVKVKPGVYYVFIKSNNRDGLTVTEITGKVHCAKVVVKDGEDANASTNFGLR